jgi:hypothetical protein
MSRMQKQALAPRPSFWSCCLRRRSCPPSPSIEDLQICRIYGKESSCVVRTQGYVQEDNEADPTSANVTRKRYVRKNKQKKATRTANPDCTPPRARTSIESEITVLTTSMMDSLPWSTIEVSVLSMRSTHPSTSNTLPYRPLATSTRTRGS